MEESSRPNARFFNKISKISDHLYNLLYLITGIIFISIIYVSSWFNEVKSDPVKLTDSFQKILQEKEKDLQQCLLKAFQIKQIFVNGNEHNTDKNFPGNFIPGDMTIQIFLKDSLVFWSDNSVPVERFDESNGFAREGIWKLGNGWYEVRTVKRQDTVVRGLILLKHEYGFQNDYLNNQFNSDFSLPQGTSITWSRTSHPVFSIQGKFLLSLVFPSGDPGAKANEPQTIIFFLSFLTGMVLVLIYVYKCHVKYASFFPQKSFFFLNFLLIVILLRLLQFYTQFPGQLYQTELFGPGYFSSSVFFPSLGDLVINSVLLVFISYVFYLIWPVRTQLEISGLKKISIITGFLFLMGSALFLVCYFIYSFILNSSIPLNLQDISNLNPISFYGLFIIWALWTSYFLILWRLIQNLIYILKAKQFIKLSPALVFGFLIIASLITTLVSNLSNDYKEKEKRKILAIKLASTRNPVTEVLYSQIEKKLFTDPGLKKIVTDAEITGNAVPDDSITNIVKSHFHNDYWARYNLQITVCTDKKSLQVQPQGYIVGCNEYFDYNIRTFGESASTEHLFYLDLGYGNENYLAIIPVGNEIHETNLNTRIYVEINSKYIYKDLGYPELLMDRKLIDFPDISDYSYAFYQDHQLLHRIGKYSFCFDLDQYLKSSDSLAFFDFDGMNHFHYQINATNDLVISKKQNTFLSVISPFSYLFIILGFSSIVFIGIIRVNESNRLSIRSLRTRLQTTTISILLISFIIIGLVVIVNIIRLTTDKNKDFLKEKTMSIFVEMQHKFGTTDNLKDTGTVYLENLLVKFSNVFFSDINVYTPDGEIIASSRPQVFDENLLSSRINPKAFWSLSHEKNAIFIHKETIGNYAYNSAYIPLYNNDNDLLGYINLPFFSRQDDLKNEISSFLVAFINVYLLLILLGALIAYLISKYITAPLQILSSKIGHIQLGVVNEKIDWSRKDEIGRLVEAYNEMVVALEQSAEKLAQSEREGAWREMARQVAHEIKNPLTPMKLSVQYLQKAWDEKAPDWDIRLEKFTKMLVDQIETLSEIASDFSNFAQMPLTVNEKLNLTEVLQSTLEIYRHLENIDFKTHYPSENPLITGDRKQLIRVFTNLLNNSTEAIGKDNQGQITIRIDQNDDWWILKFTDSGGGVSPDQADKLFQPYFTTKTGGMGLGLAIVKGILQGMNGNISFQSVPGTGTTFTITLPVYHGQ